MRPALVLSVLLAVGSAAHAQAGIPLGDLPTLARARSERQRPALLAQLEPFLADLKSDYGRNASVLDETIGKVAALGDAIVPILTEFLSPEERGSSQARALADNAARVLARLEPQVYVDTWVDLVDGTDPIARYHAIGLLGRCAGDPRAVAALLRVFPQLSDVHDQLATIRAATRLESPALAPLLISALKSPEAELRAATLDYLTRFAIADAAQPAIEALRNEKEDALLGRYVLYFRAVSRADDTVASALAWMVEGVRLDPEDLMNLVEGLATIAPADHKDVRRVLMALLERGETGALGVQAALTLQAIGEKRGARVLFDNLEERVKERRDDAGRYADRADANFAFGRHKEAIRDYEQAIKMSRGSRQAAYYLQIARCEAHRDSLTRMLHALKDSGVSADTIRQEAAKDPEFQAMLEKEQAQRFLETIKR